MSVMDEKIIDFAGLEKSEESRKSLVLSIFDHLAWGEETDDVHLLMLQNKINDYLRFIEGGEIHENFKPDTYERIVIRVIAKYSFSSDCINFLNMSREVINDAGFELEWEVSSDTDESDNSQ